MPAILNVTGVISLIIGVLGIVAVATDKSASDIAIVIGGFVGAILLFSLSFALEKLSQIEQHLRPPSDKME